MSQILAGYAALISGGSRGIGTANVKRLASDGAAVAFTYLNSPHNCEPTNQ
jgi:3-oxoacyl-[acyl-carrier protein] reductase